MKNLFKISKFNKVNDTFEFTGYDEYQITYLASSKINFFRVVVNGRLTTHKVEITHWTNIKNVLLSAVSDFKNDRIKDKNIYTKTLTMGYLKMFYNETLVKNIEKHLLQINKECSRDKLTEYNLI